jgi:hypothetical protein
VGLARCYQWRVGGQGERQLGRARIVLVSVYMHGVLRGMSRRAGCTVSDIRAALQDSDTELKWSPWLSSLVRASYLYGSMLLSAHGADSLMANDIPTIF